MVWELSEGFEFELPPLVDILNVVSTTGEGGENDAADPSLRFKVWLPGRFSDIGEEGATCSLDRRADAAGAAVLILVIPESGTDFEGTGGGGISDEMDVFLLWRPAAGLGMTTFSIFDLRTAM